ncbi:DUF2207 domain-containing protein [Membranicola marinus]|uniref:DUF2207 domain-containing protein n=1 Tax=Membranihabitans marinus TaxID=1227546 RepID=A0A953L8U7_9BACT|nr:DUF2207 domain-containing protein [Membranihabitans marinus]MBY5960192.1 DUF2207 domain-containing protein [Membranihabitans marinus]
MRCFFFLIFGLLTGWVQGQEAILDYQVDISIYSDSQIEVTETIKVRSAGYKIKHGIFRTIPTIRPDKSGRNEPAPIEIISVQRDGQKEKYHLEKSRKNMVIYIGSEDIVLDAAIYTYKLKYRADNQIGYFDEYDELYWNAIGHDWVFPVNNYSVTVRLPDGAGFLQGSCYTGYAGSTSSDCDLYATSDDQVVNSTGNNALQPGQGFTIAVAWPKGFVTEQTKRPYEISWINILLYLLGLVVFLYYAYTLWVKVGVDPPEVPVVPDWHPPKALSPAENSYIYHRSITNEAVTAALVNAAIKGVIRIENKKKKFTFHRLTESDNLELEEKSLVDSLLPPGKETFVLKSSSYSRYQSAKLNFMQSLKRKLNITDYYRQNWTQGMKALVLMAVVTTLTLTVGMYPLLPNIYYSAMVTFLLLMVAFVMLSFLFRIMKWYKWLIVIPAWGVMTGALVLIYSQVLFFTTSYILVAVIIGLALALTGFFNYLIYAPTPDGQKMRAEIKGFRLYLDKSEKSMLEFFTPPEKTPELFEKMLPFAIALGVENRWGKKFKQVLDDAIEKGTYAPVWYAGNIHQINSLHSNFQSSVTSAAPKSSSGSGGGGFSGGGGGGGGGGGW